MRPLSFALLLLVPLLAACEETVAPTLNTGAPFTLYGRLDPRADQQALRVVPIELDLAPEDEAPLDAVVTVTNLASGEVVTMRDSLVRFSDGSLGHVFVAPFRAGYNAPYRVEARRADGAVSSADLRVPPLVRPVLEAPRESALEVELPALWPAAPQVNAARVHYTVQAPDCTTRRVSLALPPERLRPFEFGWRSVVPLAAQRLQVLDAAGVPAALLREVRVELLVSDAGWVPPGGAFDPEVLVEPTAFTNVRNGFGFVGGGSPAEAEWSIGGATSARAGYLSPASLGC